MLKITFCSGVLLFGGALNSFANLVPISPVPTNLVPASGTGYGNVLTLLNAQNKVGGSDNGLETNCDIISGGSVVSSCSGPFASLTLDDPANQNQAQSIGATGITSAATAASQLLLIFNASQDSSTSITLDSIGLSLWYNGVSIFSTVSTRNDTYPTIAQGTGQAGYGYQLDLLQAGQAQTAINTAIASGATLNTILVTGAFSAGCTAAGGGPCAANAANDGPDTMFLGAHGTSVTSVPEPASVLMLGTALLGVCFGIRRRRRA